MIRVDVYFGAVYLGSRYSPEAAAHCAIEFFDRWHQPAPAWRLQFVLLAFDSSAGWRVLNRYTNDGTDH